MVGYKLVIHKNTTDLEKEVRERMIDGWKCLKGVVVKTNNEIKNGFWYIQTMIKE